MNNIDKKRAYTKPHVILSVVGMEKCNKVIAERSQSSTSTDKISEIELDLNK